MLAVTGALAVAAEAVVAVVATSVQDELFENRSGVFMKYLVALCVVFFSLNSYPARAAVELEPGEWQDTETGTENGQPAKAEVTTSCMTPEDAKDPVKALMAERAQQAGQCKTFDVKPNGNTVTFTMQCSDPKQMSFDIAGTMTFLDRKNYTGMMKSTVIFAGQKMTSDKKIDSKWLGPCKAPAGKK
jgi:hypothetical protein